MIERRGQAAQEAGPVIERRGQAAREAGPVIERRGQWPRRWGVCLLFLCNEVTR